MNLNDWIMKETVSISNSASKSSGRSGATSDYSSLTDSQFLCASQYWSDQLCHSQEMSLHSKNSQQNSQEVNEPKVSMNFQTKPYLFNGDSKDKTMMPNITFSMNKGILEQFEEEKIKAKEKAESEILLKELSQLKETMENMKISLSSLDVNTDSTKRAVTEALDSFTKALQGTMGNVHEVLSVQLGEVLNKLNCQVEALKDIQDRESKVVSEVATLVSSMHSQQRELESVRTEQAQQQCMIREVLSLLQAVASAQPRSTAVADSGVQTSPCLWEGFCLVSEKTSYFQSLQLSGGPGLAPLEEKGNLGPLQPIDPALSRSRVSNPLAVGCSEPERALPEKMEEYNAHHTCSAAAYTVGKQEKTADTRPQETAATSQPSTKLDGLGLAPEADGGIGFSARAPKRAGRQKRGIQRVHRLCMPKRRRRALPLRGGQGNSSRGRAIMPVPTSFQSSANHMPKNTGAYFNPCAGWSQDSSGMQIVSGCEATTASWAIPLSEANAGITQTGLWQLFDFCDDSD